MVHYQVHSKLHQHCTALEVVGVAQLRMPQQSEVDIVVLISQCTAAGGQFQQGLICQLRRFVFLKHILK